MSRFDWVIVGAGITGCTLAERFAALGHSVGLVEQRERIGGNCSERVDASGVLVHEYGPHIFHTDSDGVFKYLSRFTGWRSYRHRVMARDGVRVMPMGVNAESIRIIFGDRAAEVLAALAGAFGEGGSFNVGELMVHPELCWIGKSIWRAAYAQYSAKQWGGSLAKLDSAVFSRVPIRLSDDDSYFADRYQCMPRDGYQSMFDTMLAHRSRIDLILGEIWRPGVYEARRGIVYTGSIDAYFSYRFGRLPYRSVKFRFITHRSAGLLQPVAIVNYVGSRPKATRSTEFRHLTGQSAAATTISWEYPFDAVDGDIPMYPVPSRQSAKLLARYVAAARAETNVHFCGRLGTYRYLNMDVAVANALAMARELG